MPNIVKVTDRPELIATSKYEYAKFPFQNLNCVQSRLFEFFDQEANIIIAAPTSVGKTICAEMLLAHEVRKRGGKGMYLAPLKALASEKMDDWTDKDHHFGDLNVSICTGDYMLTPDRKKELERSNLIVMSSEMLNSRGRNHTSENNNWMMDVGTLAIDEFHLLAVPGRGDHLESGLIKYTKMNPKGRIIGLSATMPNVDEIAEWVSHLNGLPTYLLTSTYRPCPLYLHYEQFEDKVRSYEDREMQKVWAAMNILEEHPDDKFLVFVHTKKTGDMMQKLLKKAGFNSEYHNADLEKKKRKEVEKRFKEDSDFKVLVATSTLAWGVNVPARRVIVLGTDRGMSQVPKYDIDQMCVSFDSKIMMATGDRPHKPAHEVAVGDFVVGVHNDKLVPAQVVGKFVSRKLGKRIVFSNGTEIVCSSHPLLSWDGTWINSDEIKVGDKIRVASCHNWESSVSLKELVLEAAKSCPLYTRLDGDDLEKFRVMSRNEVSSLGSLSLKGVTKARRTGVITIALANKLGLTIRFVRSKNGSELDLENINYDIFSWFLGVLATDGNVKWTKSQSVIRLISKNELISQKFANVLQSAGLHVVCDRDRRGYYLVSSSSLPLVFIVSKLGIGPRKTRTLDVSPLLRCDRESLAGFLLGVIDGDGHVTKSSVRICTVSKIFAQQLRKMLLRCGIRSTSRHYTGSGSVLGYLCDTSHNIVRSGMLACAKLTLLSKHGGIKSKSCKMTFKKNTRPLKGDTFYTIVERIERVKETDMVNFQVSNVNTFVVEDIITHNCGRAGRPQFDPCGDVYVLLPRTRFKEEMYRLQQPQRIQSQMFDEKNPNYKTLGFHLVSEIHKGEVTTHNDVHEWYGNTLAAFQAKQLKQEVVEGVMTGLEKCGAIRKEDEEYSTTSLGRVASMFYFSPWDVSDLARNFGRLFKAGKENDDAWVSLALGNTDSHRPNFVSNAEKEEVDAFLAKLHHTDAVNVIQGSVMVGAVKAAYCYHMLLKGQNNPTFSGLQNTLRFDSGRTIQVLNAIDSMVGKWGKKEFFRELHLRIVYGVGRDLLGIIKLKGIGAVKAQKLYDVGLTSYGKIAASPNKVMLALGCSPKVAEKIVVEAKELADKGE